MVLAGSALAGPRTELVGRVTTIATGAPIIGATVTAGGSEARTNHDGLYRIVLAGPGTYTVDIAFDSARSSREVIAHAGEIATLDATLDLDTSETIVIREVRPAVVAKPVKHYSSIAPPYSDYAKVHDTWTRAWLLLDIDETGKVSRVKFLHRPGADLDDIAVREALKLQFEPARDASGAAMPSRMAWTIEWPSYWWLVVREGVTTRIPPTVNSLTCKGNGPMNLDRAHAALRDCSRPDFSAAEREPWITDR
jgi:hypothetical protein